jgi:hypothetical protein
VPPGEMLKFGDVLVEMDGDYPPGTKTVSHTRLFVSKNLYFDAAPASFRIPRKNHPLYNKSTAQEDGDITWRLKSTVTLPLQGFSTATNFPHFQFQKNVDGGYSLSASDLDQYLSSR